MSFGGGGYQTHEEYERQQAFSSALREVTNDPANRDNQYWQNIALARKKLVNPVGLAIPGNIKPGYSTQSGQYINN